MRHSATKRLCLAMLIAMALACLAGPALADPKLTVTGLPPLPDTLYAGTTVTVTLIPADAPEHPDDQNVLWSGELTLKDGSTIDLYDLDTEPKIGLDPTPEMEFKVVLPKPGKLALTCTYTGRDNASYSPNITVDVIGAPAVGVDLGPADVSPDQWASADLAVRLDKRLDLAAALLPTTTEDKIESARWTSSNEDVATVEKDPRDPAKATLTGIGVGTVEITVTVTTDRISTNGQPAKYTAERTVTVTGKTEPKAELLVRKTKDRDGNDLLWVEWSDADEAVTKFDLFPTFGPEASPTVVPLATSRSHPATFLLSEIRTKIDDYPNASKDRIRVECVGQGETLGTREVDLSKFDELPDAPKAQDVQMKREDGTTVEATGPGVSLGTAEDGTQFLWLPEGATGGATVNVKVGLPGGATTEATQAVFVPAGDTALEELATLLNDEIERLRGFANNKTTYTAPEQVVADLRSAVKRCTDLMSKKEWQKEDDLRKALNALVTSLSKATAIMATPRSNDDVFILLREILTPKLINEVVVDLQHVLNVNAPIAQKETGNALDVQKKGTVDGTFTVRTGRTGGSAEGTLFISGVTITGTISAPGTDMVSTPSTISVPIVVGKGKVAAGETTFRDEQGDEVSRIDTRPDMSKETAPHMWRFGLGGFLNQLDAVPSSSVAIIGGTLTLSKGEASVEKAIPADRISLPADETTKFEFHFYKEDLSDLHENFMIKYKPSTPSASAATGKVSHKGTGFASSDDEAEEEPFILTVSVEARRTDTGAEGVTVASIPAVIASDGSGGGSSGGCDAVGLGALALIACAALALARRRG